MDSTIAEVFPHYLLSFSILAIFREKRVVKVGHKVQTLARFFFMKTWILQSLFKQCFCLLLNVFECYLWWEFSAMLGHIWGSKGPKSSQKELFMDAESIRKTLKTFNLTTTTAILMKSAATFAEKILNGKLHFLCSIIRLYLVCAHIGPFWAHVGSLWIYLESFDLI